MGKQRMSVKAVVPTFCSAVLDASSLCKEVTVLERTLDRFTNLQMWVGEEKRLA